MKYEIYSIMPAPNFIIIGAQKCGTSAAGLNLNKHSEVYVVNSEVHFFDYYTSSNRTKKKYFSLFTKTNSRGKALCGEKSPEYMYIDYCAEAIKEVCPHVKFICFLRDPIARAFSHWNMNTKKGIESRSFAESVSANLSNLSEVRSNKTSRYHYVQRGFYMDQLERWYSVFSDYRQTLIVINEHMRSHPHREFARMFEFLGVSNESIDIEEEYVGVYSESIDSSTLKHLKKVFRPHNKRLFKFIGFTIREWI